MGQQSQAAYIAGVISASIRPDFELVSAGESDNDDAGVYSFRVSHPFMGVMADITVRVDWSAPQEAVE